MLFNILLGALAVVLGALGSHIPPENLGPSNIDRFEVAQRHHMFHVLVFVIGWIIFFLAFAAREKIV